MQKWIYKNKNKKGFTLIELVVVIAILGILAAIAIPRFTGTRETANEGVVVANLRNIQSAVEVYAANNNIVVTTIETADGTATNDITSVLGLWPTGPGTTSYSVVKGVATATLDTGIPYPKTDAATPAKTVTVEFPNTKK